MASLLVPTPEGYRIMNLTETRHVLADGNECWVFRDGEGNQVLTRVGRDVELIKCVGESPEGLALEFGVAGGTSIRALAQSGRTIYGFDWWKGLPHAWNEADGRGSFECKRPDVPPNVTLIDGLFSDTLESFLETHRDAVAFVHVDCDLYCPTVYLLHALVDRFVTGSIIAFDEIDQGCFGEMQAWGRYLNETGQDWEFIGKQHPFGEVYRMR